jgi:hypothetical protein
VIIEILALALASTARPTSVAAVYALLARDEPRRLIGVYTAAGLVFTLAFGAIVLAATQGIHLHSGTDKAVADLVGGVLVLIFGFAVLTGLIQGRHSGDAPGGRFQTALGRRITVRTAALAGPLTHIPGLFYVIALNVIIAHNTSTAEKVIALVVYNVIWFALPVLALLLCITDPDVARRLVSGVQEWTHDHAREILLVASFSAGTALVTRGALGFLRLGRHLGCDVAGPPPLLVVPWPGSYGRLELGRGARVLPQRRGKRGGLEHADRAQPRLGVGIPRPLAARQGRPLDTRGQLHGLLLLERLRQGRADHLGEPGRRLPADRSGQAGSRAARLSPGSVVLLVHLLTGAPQVSVRSRRAARALAPRPRREPGPGRGVRTGRGRR